MCPGLIHQFGNVLFIIQGMARAPDGAGRDAILTATDRGSRSLQVARCLIGDPLPNIAEVGSLLADLVDVARVPVRERRQQIELVGPTVASRVDAAELVPLVVEGLLELLNTLPQGVSGRVRMSMHADANAVAVCCDFQAGAGNLPFPLAFPAAAASVTATGQRFGWRGSCRARPQGLELVVAAVSGNPGFQHAEA